MKFQIQELVKSPEQFDQGLPVIGTGNDIIKSARIQRFGRLIGENKIKYITGLEESDYTYSPFLKRREKDITFFKKELKKYREIISSAYSDDALDPTNKFFWGKEGLKWLVIVPKNESDFYDDINPAHLLIRLGIISGAFPAVAPSVEDAIEHNVRYYMVEQEEANMKSYKDEFGSKLEAMAALNDLVSKKGNDAILNITWSLSDINQGFTRNTSPSVLLKHLMEYIEGKHVKSGKKRCAAEFLEKCQEFDQNREEFLLKVMIKAAYHFGLVFFKDGKYHTSDKQLTLGSTFEDSIKILSKPENLDELTSLQDEVDKRFNK